MSLGYEIRYKSSIKKDLSGLPKKEIKRILDAIESTLKLDPYRGKKLTGKFEGLYRIRIGNYRVIYAIEGKEVWVLRIRHRKHIYR